MHFLDLIMYFVCALVLWKILELISGRQFTEELGGGLIGTPIMVLFTIIYVILFAFKPDWNWSEFNYAALKTWFKW